MCETKEHCGINTLYMSTDVREKLGKPVDKV